MPKPFLLAIGSPEAQAREVAGATQCLVTRGAFLVLLTIWAGGFSFGCVHRGTSEVTYIDIVLTPQDRGSIDMQLLKITDSQLVTIRTRYGRATARPGEYFVTEKGEKLERLKSVDTKTGKVVVEGILIQCPG